jgi:hypothetical protein
VPGLLREQPAESIAIVSRNRFRELDHREGRTTNCRVAQRWFQALASYAAHVGIADMAHGLRSLRGTSLIEAFVRWMPRHYLVDAHETRIW